MANSVLILALLALAGGEAFAESTLASSRAAARDVLRTTLDPFPPHPLELADPAYPIYGRWLAAILGRTAEVSVAEARLEPAALPSALAEREPDGLGAVLAAERKGIARCVQWATRQSGEQNGRLVMRITVSREGAVTQVELEENQLTLELAGCVRERVAAWQLPAQPEPVRFTHLWIF